MGTVIIITGESSGELYGALLTNALKKKWPELRIIGVGGDRMSKAEVELISGISAAFGLTEVFSALRDLKAAFKKTTEAIKKFMPDVLVLIDYPDFNIKVAGFAKALGVKILYYVSPQVWAWRKGRVKKIAGLVDRMAVILPFEAEIYRRAGVSCEFVGHPILEEIEDVLPPHPPLGKGGQRGGCKTALGLDPDRPLLSLLPGSRPHELKRLLPLMIEVIRQFKMEFVDYQFCIPLASNTDEGTYSYYLDALRQEGAIIKKGETIRALAASDMTVVASGTATLQAAFIEVPMVVIYKLSPLTYQLGRLIVDVKYISLVNLLSGRGVVPELLQQRANPADILRELKRIMFDIQYREKMLRYYQLIKEPFLRIRASERVAEIIVEMAGWER
ncbi:MAG: lipid-A-disaccharide synthase [Thermodesulfovibrionales bacterium]|nr:lipid-A-disaccharide synthase [Thermodesulfovibrionales bacterium]